MTRPLRVAVEHACPSTRSVLCPELAAHPGLQVLAADTDPCGADVVLMRPGQGAVPSGPDLILLTSPGGRGPAIDTLLAAPADRLVDVVELPDGAPGDPEALRRTARVELVPTLLALAAAREPVTWCTPLPGPIGAGAPWPDSPFTVLAIGSGRGGGPALRALLAALPPDLPVPVVVVQHLPRGYHVGLADRLARLLGPGGLRVGAGRSWLLAPGQVRLVDGSVDGLFRTVARSHGDGVLAVVLGGLGRDGVQGATVLRASGGTVFGQDEASTRSALWGMPGTVAAAGQADRLVPLADLPAALTVTLTRRLPVILGRHARTDRPDLVAAGR